MTVYIFVVLCLLSPTNHPHFFQDELIISLTYQHKCQWRIQQSRFASISCSPGGCSSAWQDIRELAAASLGGFCSWVHWVLREVQGGQVLAEKLGSWCR